MCIMPRFISDGADLQWACDLQKDFVFAGDLRLGLVELGPTKVVTSPLKSPEPSRTQAWNNY